MDSPTKPPTSAQDHKPIIQLKNVSKMYGNTRALTDVNLDIYRGEFFSLLGASGCGKSTLLRVIAGFESPTTGEVFIDGQDVTDMPPYLRPTNMMFQSYALFPHMTVFDNVAYGLKQDRVPKAQIRERVEKMLALTSILNLARRKPEQLSGGQRQRVALARSLVKEPKLLLLDEPLGALDKKLRGETQFELVNIQEHLNTTFVVVTHDQEEAMTMSSRIALMHEGMIEQIDTPRRIYEFPISSYAADFIGLANIFKGVVESQRGDLVTVFSEEINQSITVTHMQPLAIDMDVSVIVRPEKVQVVEQDSQMPNTVSGIIKEIAYLGDVSIYHAELDSGKLVKFTQPNTLPLAEQPFTWNQQVSLNWSPNTAGILVQ
ncbi:MAG: ABC transporter ATP-binding protein [Arenicella sp.]|nr:ABC transporter ATP-binding protein [Arenicella sp.]